MVQRQADRVGQQDHRLAPLSFRAPRSPDSTRHRFAMKKFLTTAPVFAAIWFTLTAGILIEFNRFYPDLLFHPL